MAKKIVLKNYNIDTKTKIIVVLAILVFWFVFIQRVKADTEMTVDDLETQLMRLEMQSLKLQHQIKKMQATPGCSDDSNTINGSEEELFEESEFDMKLPEE